jgi:hypothetical protein
LVGVFGVGTNAVVSIDEKLEERDGERGKLAL